jgi:hypothetical protein
MWLPLPEMAFKDELSYFGCILLLKGELCSFSDCSSVSLFESDYVFFTLLLAEILNQRNSFFAYAASSGSCNCKMMATESIWGFLFRLSTGSSGAAIPHKEAQPKKLIDIFIYGYSKCAISIV